MPEATALKGPLHEPVVGSLSMTFTGRIVTCAAPATPAALFVSAPRMPATCVPWPQASETSVLPATKL